MPPANNRRRSFIALPRSGQSRLTTGKPESTNALPTRLSSAATNSVFRRNRLAKPGRDRSISAAMPAAVAYPAGKELLPVTIPLPSSRLFRSHAGPRIAPPKLPNALLNVVDWITSQPPSPPGETCSTVPRNRAPSTPAPWASSIHIVAPRGRTRASSATGAIRPVAPKTPSVTSRRRRVVLRLAKRLAKSAASQCR